MPAKRNKPLPAENAEDNSIALYFPDLLKMQRSIAEGGKRAIVLFEGRALSGKSGAIAKLCEAFEEDGFRVAANYRGDSDEWFLSRCARELPRRGEIALFDRGWYRESDDESSRERAIHQIPLFEKALIEEGFSLVKYFLEIGKEELERRLEKQKSREFKRLKLTARDLKSLKTYDDYSKNSAALLLATHTPDAPWFVVLADDKRAARAAIAAHLLRVFDPKRKGADCPIVKRYEPKVRF